MLYIYSFSKQNLLKSVKNLDEVVAYILANNYTKTKNPYEIKQRLQESLKNNIVYSGLIFSNNEVKDFSQYGSRTKMISMKYAIGDVINKASTQYKILEINKNKENRTVFKLLCLNCNHEKIVDSRSLARIAKCNKCSLNTFRLSQDKTYWIGNTQKGDEFWFNGNEEVINYIKNSTWRKTVYGYFQNGIGQKLHRVVMEVNTPKIIVNHIGGNRWDCRKEKLEISNNLANSKEKQSKDGKIVGLLKRASSRWIGHITVNGTTIYSKYRDTKEEALIDLLIMQKYYGFKHNIDLFYKIENVDLERWNVVIANCERRLNAKTACKKSSSNKLNLSEDKSFYYVYDADTSKEFNSFKISLQSKDLIKNYKWYIAFDNSASSKLYVHGNIITKDNKRKNVRLHRYLLNLTDKKYKDWYVDHINGDSLDNRLDNLQITNAKGNGHKLNSRGYHERGDSPGCYRAAFTVEGIKYDKTFPTEKQAAEYVEQIRENSFKNRLCFKNK